MSQTTIAAIATPFGKGALSIVRVSGPNAIVKINKVFKGANLVEAQPNTIHYGKIIQDGILIDEVMVAVYHAPKSYTGEAMVEVFCHGGILITENVLKTILSLNIEHAMPGEFTQRAYLNGKMDLIQAESVMDVIEADNDYALQIAKHGLQAELSRKINQMRQEIMGWISHIEVNIDYPEYESEYALAHESLKPQVMTFLKSLNILINESKKNKLIREGIKTVIVGRPNVGKSSLLNAFIDEEKAIVTNIPGTTRDIVEGDIQLKGLALHLIDTAGIRETEDQVESIGVTKSKQMIDQAELVIFVVDASSPLTTEDETILSYLSHKPHIIVGNKVDVGKIQLPEEAIYISAINKTGFDVLEKKILSLFALENIETRDLNFLSNKRQIDLVEKAKMHIIQALETIENNVPIDMVQLDLRHAWEALTDISGERYHESLIEDMFGKFCLGK